MFILYVCWMNSYYDSYPKHACVSLMFVYYMQAIAGYKIFFCFDFFYCTSNSSIFFALIVGNISAVHESDCSPTSLILPNPAPSLLSVFNLTHLSGTTRIISVPLI
jgi:hypothetical protein